MNEQVLYKYSKMELKQFAIFEENLRSEEKDLQYQTELQFSYDKENRILCSKVIITAMQREKIVMKADLRSYFDIAEESVSLLQQDNIISFPPALLVQFASLCYGAARGIIHERTQESCLNEYILPPAYFGNLIDRAFIIE